jgi:3,4-dihydroxy 2-butanone 4-phosphate synthase/GTP cyclohydrolase II
MVAADSIDAHKVNFLMQEARGLICLAISHHLADKLKLPMMKSEFHSSPVNHAAFTISIEAKRGIKTGISARERAHTIRTATDPMSTEGDIVCPGHVFPIVAREGGVLVRPGHTEAAVDLAYLSGRNPATVICEILNSDGEAANSKEIESFAKKFEIKIGSVEDLIIYRKSFRAE